MKNHSIGLIIWRPLVQAQAGPHFYYSDLRFGVGRCFLVFIRTPFFEAKLGNGDLLK